MVTGIIFYALKLVDRIWDSVDKIGTKKIEGTVAQLEERNRIARDTGNVEEMNATRAALDEIARKLRARSDV